MNAHHFVKGVRVQRFCLTLLGEARLWFQSLEPLGNVMWPQLQNLFRQRYSKLGNTWEQLFHAWRSFSFDENTGTIDSYIMQIIQVATLLGYEEPQILEVFKNTLPTKLYWILFPIEDLRQAVETAKIILTKEKLDKQLTGQTSTSPFMNIRDGTERKVSFNARDELGDKIDKLTFMMSRLVAKDSNEKRPFKPQIYKSRGQSRSYNQRSYQNRSGRSDSRTRGQYGSNRPRQNYRGNNFRGNTTGYGRQDSRGEYRDNRHNDYNRSRDRWRERTFSRNYGNNRDRISSNSRSRSGSRSNTNRDRIRCYNCREYDHFVRHCPNSREERDSEKLQQMLNMEAEEQIPLLTNRQDSPAENNRSPLNLWMGGMAPSAFLPLDSRTVGQGRDNYPTVGQFLTREQTRYIYRKVETGETINTDMKEQEIEQEKTAE